MPSLEHKKFKALAKASMIGGGAGYAITWLGKRGRTWP
jgi:hypothetical protein